MTTAAGTWYPPAAGTGGFLLTNPPFAMTATDRIRAAIQRCIEANHEPSDGSDIAAAVLQEAAEVLFPEKPEPIEPIPMTTARAINHAEHWSAWCALKAAKERLRALALDLDDTDYGNHIPDASKMVGQPAPPADVTPGPSIEAVGSLIAWLTEQACRAADAGQSTDAGMLAWAAQVIGERVDEDAPAPMAERGAIGPEWQPCVKLPITVHVREQWPGETQVSTREGITPVRPDDLIMRGVQGEEYPIGRELFNKTYRLGTAGHQPAPAAEGEVAELVKTLRELAYPVIVGSGCAVKLRRAADLLEQRHPAPAPASEGEVAELALKELERTVVLLMPVTGHKKIKRFDAIRAALKRLQELENNADLSPAPAPAEGEVGDAKHVRRMCEIILGNMFGNEELDSLALLVGHHSDVLNASMVPVPVPAAEREVQ